MKNITHADVRHLAGVASDFIKGAFPGQEIIKAYPIPRGGVPAAYAIASFFGRLQQFRIVDRPEEAHLFIDDLIDSGSTMRRFANQYHGLPFVALLDKRHPDGFMEPNEWIVWPWEGSAESSIEDNIVRMLQYIGEDPTRGGLKETPKRVAKAWKEWSAGYSMKVETILKTFEDGAAGVNEMVLQKDIPFYSHCEHHMAPFFGTVSIAYIPHGKIVGLSKLTRLVWMFAKRLQVQERLTNEIANALESHLSPLGVGVVVKARHLCMESRGVDKQGQSTVTSALRGAIKDKPEARAEFLQLTR